MNQRDSTDPEGEDPTDHPLYRSVSQVLRGLRSADASDLHRDIKLLKVMNLREVWVALARGHIDEAGRVITSSEHPATYHRAQYTLWALNALGELKSCHQLDVSGMGLTEPSFLATCSNLTRLDLSGNALESLSGLDACVELSRLVIDAEALSLDGAVEMISALPALTHLEVVLNATADLYDLRATLSSLQGAQLTSLELRSDQPLDLCTLLSAPVASPIPRQASDHGSTLTAASGDRVALGLREPPRRSKAIRQRGITRGLTRGLTSGETSGDKRGLTTHQASRRGLADPLSSPSGSSSGSSQPLRSTCYVCHEQLKGQHHHHYPQICPPCGEVNFEKRSLSGDLSGRVALVTGARVKIGFETALFLLRSGCQVIATTRFTQDAAERYAAQPDFDEWRDRLTIYGLDLRHPTLVERFCDHLKATLGHLDILINNACQTIRRPPIFYREVIEREQRPLEDLAPPLRSLIGLYHARSHSELTHSELTHSEPTHSEPTHSAPTHSALTRSTPSSALARSPDPLDALLSDPTYFARTPLLPEDYNDSEEDFPPQSYDADLQQRDLRRENSWVLELAEVSTVEWLETALINQIAPALLNARLKSLMIRAPQPDRYIVNVSAMEGKFYRPKQSAHPHTNMAKAALNMMTRTSAIDYARDGIYMNSVDTGWVTEELPDHEDYEGFRLSEPPLDSVDGAARVVDPIFEGINHQRYLWGHFLKDYAVTDW